VSADGMPEFDFPWADGETHTWTSGPHGASLKGDICIDCGFDDVPLEDRAGLDFGGSGWLVHPMADGVVIFSGHLGAGFGYGVVVDHGDGWQTIYAHLLNDDALIATGVDVTRDSDLGHVGCTEDAVCFGDHLHVDLRRGASVASDGSLRFGVRVTWDARQIHGWTFTADEGNYEGTAVRCGTTIYAGDDGSAAFTAGDDFPCDIEGQVPGPAVRRPKPAQPQHEEVRTEAPLRANLGVSVRTYFANMGAALRLELSPAHIYRVRIPVAADR
jgi:hypothetical protein